MNSVGFEPEPLSDGGFPVCPQQFVEHHNLVPVLSNAQDFDIARIRGIIAQCVKVSRFGINPKKGAD